MLSRLSPGCRALALTAAFVTTLVTAPAFAQSIEQQFRTWLERDLWPEAQGKGIERSTFDVAFEGVTPNLKLPDLVLPGRKAETPKTQHQAEFGAPANYFGKSLGSVISGGRQRAATLAQALSRAERASGVHGPIILAIWGRESGFGAAKIPYDAFEVLGTKAFLATRKAMFRTETLAALAMMQTRGVTRSQMRSSWAGALGQPQFLPTSFVKFATDGDGDGRADIWESQADTIASIAAYLQGYGWQKGRDWGFEVTVPPSISCSLEGPDRGKTIREWSAMGVARIGGRAFPAAELPREGFLLMPAGRNGPAFIVTPNFYVLKDYNESDLYALFIGHAADRIAGSGRGFAGTWGEVDKLYRSDIASMQRALEKLGYDVGGADGLPGYKTRRSIGAWQEKQGRAATCFPDLETVRSLR